MPLQIFGVYGRHHNGKYLYNMIVTSTEVIQVKLSSAITTRQMNIYSSYNNITSTTLTPSKNATTTNNTTAVTLLPTPSSGQQNQLRYCSIYNDDTVDNTVTIQLSGTSGTRTIFSSYLFVGDYIQYAPAKGWQVYNHNGILKNYGLAQNPTQVRALTYFNAINATTTLTTTSGTDYAFYLGRADRSYNQVSVMYNVITALGATITWAELAIYKGYPTIGANTLTLTRCGFKDCNFSTGQSGFAATGVKTSVINVSNISAGDELWAVFGSVTSGVNMALMAGIADNVGAGFMRSATGSLRPSTNSTITFTIDTTSAPAWLSWQGFQW